MMEFLGCFAIVSSIMLARWLLKRDSQTREIPARGTHVIETPGLPDGYVPPSGSLVPPPAVSLTPPPQRGMAPGTTKLPPPIVGPAKVPQPPTGPYVEWGTSTGQTAYVRPHPRVHKLRELADQLREVPPRFSPGGIIPTSPRFGPTAEEAGANMAAAASAVFGPCAHPRPIPVELVLTGEIVAALCPDCDRQLPAHWGLTSSPPLSGS